MKLVKLSLVAALAAGAFSVASATPLDEAIKDVDVSGVLRYRYNNGRVVDGVRSRAFQNGGLFGGPGGIGSPKQAHQFVAKLGFQAAIADNFKAYLEFYYNPGNENGFGDGSVGTNTASTFNVRQYYLTYTADAVDTSVLFGKMQVESIWTTNFLGLVGTGAKILNTSLEGTILAAYAFDNFDAKGIAGRTWNPNGQNDPGWNNRSYSSGVEGDTLLSNGRFNRNLSYNPFTRNLYGVAAIGSYDVGFGQFNPQLWLAYLTDTAFFYALDLGLKTSFDDLVWKLNLGYLGNAAQSDYKNIGVNYNENNQQPRPTITPFFDNQDFATNGNFVGLNGTIEYMGFDATLGGVYYGDKNQFSMTTLEDTGNIGHLLAGQEIFYTNGSNLTGDIGQNVFGFIKAGYTFDEVLRLGVDLVYGGTKVELPSTTSHDNGAGKKFEAVARVNYKYSPKLDFSAWYSYVDIDAKVKQGDNSKNSVRLQALYKF